LGISRHCEEKILERVSESLQRNLEMQNLNENRIPIRILATSDAEIIRRNSDFAAFSMRALDLTKCYILKNSVVLDSICKPANWRILRRSSFVGCLPWKI
jgi:hypothetical protein